MTGFRATYLKEMARSLLLRGVARGVAPRGGRTVPPRRILLIRPDHLGDVLFLTPALRALREAQPQASITVLVGPWAASLLENNPDVDAVETVRFPWFDRAPKAGAGEPYRRLYEAARQLRGRFDVAVICRFDHWWGAWLAAAAGIPRIVGYATRDVAPFLTDPVPYHPARHEVAQNLALLGVLGTPASADPGRYPLRFPVSDEARIAARGVLAEQGLPADDAPLVAIHPGSGAPVKRWQVERWAALMATLHAYARGALRHQRRPRRGRAGSGGGGRGVRGARALRRGSNLAAGARRPVRAVRARHRPRQRAAAPRGGGGSPHPPPVRAG